MLKSALCISSILLLVVGSVCGQEQFLKDGEHFKGLYASFSNTDQATAISGGLLLAPSNWVGVGLGFGKVTSEGTSVWVTGPAVSVWPINEARQNSPVSLCLFGAFDMAIIRDDAYPDWVYGLGALLGKNINLSDRLVLQPYAGMSMQNSEFITNPFLQVSHIGVTFASRTNKGGIGFAIIQGSFFENVHMVSFSLGILGP